MAAFFPAVTPSVRLLSFQPRDASLFLHRWLYLGSWIIYGLVLSINTRVTWPHGRSGWKKERVQLGKKGVSAHERARDGVFEGGGPRARRAGENGWQPYLIHRTNDTSCSTRRSRRDARPSRRFRNSRVPVPFRGCSGSGVSARVSRLNGAQRCSFRSEVSGWNS